MIARSNPVAVDDEDEDENDEEDSSKEIPPVPPLPGKVANGGA